MGKDINTIRCKVFLKQLFYLLNNKNDTLNNILPSIMNKKTCWNFYYNFYLIFGIFIKFFGFNIYLFYNKQ